MPLILETADESRWAEEIAELKRFSERGWGVAAPPPGSWLFGGGIFVRISIRKFVNRKRIQYLWIGVCVFPVPSNL